MNPIWDNIEWQMAGATMAAFTTRGVVSRVWVFNNANRDTVTILWDDENKVHFKNWIMT